MKKTIKIIIFTALFLVLLTFGLKNKLSLNKVFGKTAQAVGDLIIDWGVPPGEPIFKVSNFLPGEVVEKTVALFNGSSSSLPVAVVGVKTEEIKNLSNFLEITISQNGSDLYGGSLGTKTLAQFFQESQVPNALFLLDLNPGESQKLNFKVKFKENTDNSHQGAKVVFDISLGLYYQVPEECRGIKFTRPPIFGSSRNDRLYGTNGNDLIFGFGGNDHIYGSNGDDCLVGGEGNDFIDGSNGNDVILGENGNDRFFGSNGDDLIKAGRGNDKLDGSNGNDRLFGEEGDDYLDGGNNNDQLFGGDGNDTLSGGNGNDILIGNSDYDKADGGLNQDRCEAEKKPIANIKK